VDSHDPQRVALLSIRPEYAAAIFTGRKTVEFRRSRLASDVEFAIVYATQPTGMVIGWFRIQGIAESTPDGLWRRYRGDGAIRRRDYFAYFDGAERAYAIEISKPTALEAPLLLDEIVRGMRAPQSFQYLPAPVVEALLREPSSRRAGRPSLRPAFA
jgi:predicted transcriptional regulator